MNFAELGIEEIRTGIMQKKFSAKEVTEAALENMERWEPNLHAFLTPTAELAQHAAEKTDQLAREGKKLLALSGVPCAVKDAILVKGVRCTAGSRILENYIAPYDAFVIEKLKEAGAAIVGKTNMDEFGMGASTENSAFGPTMNPWDKERVSGGSSGGSAASVAAAESTIALGEDTGGSVRQPASFCGVVGLRPTYGAVSRSGVIALASSLDQVGPFAKTARDAEILFSVITRKDQKDATSVANTGEKTSFDIAKVKIGIPKEYFGKGLAKEVEESVKDAIAKLEAAGAQIVEVELPNTEYALAAYYVINTSEASANLARYDGVRYGAQKEARDIFNTYLVSRGAGLGKETKRRIMLGAYALSAGYYDAYYLKAQKVRTLLKRDFEQAFKKADVLVGPTSPVLPFKLGERMQDPLSMYLVDVYTVPVSLAGLPAVSLPVARAGSLPVGLQAIAPPFQENLLFSLGKTLETLYT